MYVNSEGLCFVNRKFLPFFWRERSNSVFLLESHFDNVGLMEMLFLHPFFTKLNDQVWQNLWLQFDICKKKNARFAKKQK